MTPTTEEPKKRIYHIRIDDKPEALVHADTICTESDLNLKYVTLKRDGEIVGKFTGRIADWWIEETED